MHDHSLMRICVRRVESKAKWICHHPCCLVPRIKMHSGRSVTRRMNVIVFSWKGSIMPHYHTWFSVASIFFWSLLVENSLRSSELYEMHCKWWLVVFWVTRPLTKKIVSIGLVNMSQPKPKSLKYLFEAGFYYNIMDTGYIEVEGLSVYIYRICRRLGGVERTSWKSWMGRRGSRVKNGRFSTENPKQFLSQISKFSDNK